MVALMVAPMVALMVAATLLGGPAEAFPVTLTKPTRPLCDDSSVHWLAETSLRKMTELSAQLAERTRQVDELRNELSLLSELRRESCGGLRAVAAGTEDRSDCEKLCDAALDEKQLQLEKLLLKFASARAEHGAGVPRCQRERDEHDRILNEERDQHERQVGQLRQELDDARAQNEQLRAENARLVDRASALRDSGKHDGDDGDDDDEVVQLRERLQHAEQQLMKSDDGREAQFLSNRKLLRSLASQVDRKSSKPIDCMDIQVARHSASGLYTIYPLDIDIGVEVYCDLSADDGGWLVVQRRSDGEVDFQRGWLQYENGFGDKQNEFWLGNKLLNMLTSQRLYQLRIDMSDWHGHATFAEYEWFHVDHKDKQYRLSVHSYSGTAGDGLSRHTGMEFSSVDRDNDQSLSGHCSQLFGGGGWWFERCYDSNLNGIHTSSDNSSGIVWFPLHRNHRTLRFVEMKIRPLLRHAASSS